MKRMIVLAAVLALSAAGIATAATNGTKIKLRKTSVGKILTNSRGFTVYEFARDSKNKDKCVKIRFCTSTWPLVTTKGKPVAGPGVNKSLLGTIKVGKKTQVTYNGHPLYTYVGDASPGETSYVGVSMYGGKWNALNAKGKIVK
jgi:predicted lipoprotein with Yx(FWY)xxD motif